jgi:hypothetical protein
MLLRLAFRHLLVRKSRAFFLLAGYGIGAGVMLVLLGVGQAMLVQSSDVTLVGGGQLTVLPEGIDIEGLRTGALSGMYFGIDRARFVTRQLIGGPRHRTVVTAVSPVIEQKLVYLTRGTRTLTLRAGGEIPSRAAAVGAGLRVIEGSWEDTPADLAYIGPSPGQLYDEVDRFHLPATPDSTWAEWHYFNVVTGSDEWWHISFLLGGLVGGPPGDWGGQLLVTHHRPGGAVRRFTADVPSERVSFDTATADLVLGDHSVRQHEGVYRVRGQAEGMSFDFTLAPAAHQYFQPVELAPGELPSGYTVPALKAAATGRFCSDGTCRMVTNAGAYHDHNWGVWRGTTWEWGRGDGERIALLYGGVLRNDRDSLGASPFFLALFDSLGIVQVYRFAGVRQSGTIPARGAAGVTAPASLGFTATRDRDTLRLEVQILHAQASRAGAGSFGRWFLQMRGAFRLEGTAAGQRIRDEGKGFFETWLDSER